MDLITSFGEFVFQLNKEIATLLPADITLYLYGVVIVMLVLAAWRIVT